MTESEIQLRRQRSNKHMESIQEQLIAAGYSEHESQLAYDDMIAEHGPKNFSLQQCLEYLEGQRPPNAEENGQTQAIEVSSSDKPLGLRRARSLEFLSVDSVSLTWENIRYTVGKEGNDEKVILDNVCGGVAPGQLLAIMGPSGSGKTSLLHILTGHLAATSGTIWYDGVEKSTSAVSSDVMGFNGNAAFVSQDDTLIGALTVKETLSYAAQLKRPGASSASAANQVEKLIKYLGLTNAQDALIGTPFFKGISGGQKRRVSLGCELVTQPAILFLDEITSGLDSTSAYKIMNILFDLTQHGHTIVLTIHQPSSRIWDMLVEENARLLLLESGSTVYDGLAVDCITFFEKVGAPIVGRVNPLDHFIDVINLDYSTGESDLDLVSNLKREYNGTLLLRIRKDIEKLNKHQHDLEKAVIAQRARIVQVWILLKRSFVNNLRNPATYLIRIMMYAGLCLALGSMYWQIGTTPSAERDRISILFFIAAFLTFMSISAMPAFVEERAIYIREHTNNYYGPFTYSVANFLSGLPWIFLIALISSGIIYGLIQSRLGGRFFAIYLANLFVALEVAESMMVAISAVSPHFMVGIAGGAGLLGLYMILCGFFLMPSNIPPGWKWAHYGVSFHTYTFQIFMYNEFKDFKSGQIDGNAVLRTFDMGNVDIAFNFGILMAMTGFYRIVFYIFLRLFNRTRS